jgi:hypothetical protein
MAALKVFFKATYQVYDLRLIFKAVLKLRFKNKVKGLCLRL